MDTRREKKRTVLTKPISQWINWGKKMAKTKIKARIKKVTHK